MSWGRAPSVKGQHILNPPLRFSVECILDHWCVTVFRCAMAKITYTISLWMMWLDCLVSSSSSSSPPPRSTGLSSKPFCRGTVQPCLLLPDRVVHVTGLCTEVKGKPTQTWHPPFSPVTWFLRWINKDKKDRECIHLENVCIYLVIVVTYTIVYTDLPTMETHWHINAIKRYHGHTGLLPCLSKRMPP